MKKLILSIITIFTAFIVAVAPVYASEKCALTSILGNSICNADGTKLRDRTDGSKLNEGEYNCSCDTDGDSIFDILRLVVNIMTIGIGILGIIGITVVGVQYLTAGGDEEQTRKAKRRMFEIILGLVIYAAFFAILNWLLPGFSEATDKISNLNTIIGIIH